MIQIANRTQTIRNIQRSFRKSMTRNFLNSMRKTPKESRNLKYDAHFLPKVSAMGAVDSKEGEEIIYDAVNTLFKVKSDIPLPKIKQEIETQPLEREKKLDELKAILKKLKKYDAKYPSTPHEAIMWNKWNEYQKQLSESPAKSDLQKDELQLIERAMEILGLIEQINLDDDKKT